jgi:uncharacterized linocin/CFP29 family protein
MANEVNWPDAVWKDIRDAVVKEVAKVRVVQKVFPTTVLDTSPTEVIDDIINFADMSIREGSTKSFVEIFQEFPVTNTQVAKEAQLNTTRTLAQMAAKAIALGEDMIIFQGTNGNLPANVSAEQRDSAELGLLGVANPEDANDGDPTKVSVPIDVNPVDEEEARAKRPGIERRRGVIYGENMFTAVSQGIAKLTSKGQAPKFALFLPTRAYADTFAPPSVASLVTTADRIRPLVEGGFYGTSQLPDNRGLLAALGGDPTVIYVGREATCESVRQDGSKMRFRVVERVQFVGRDPRAFVLLKLN